MYWIKTKYWSWLCRLSWTTVKFFRGNREIFVRSCTNWLYLPSSSWSSQISMGFGHIYWRNQNADLVTFTEEILNGKLHFLCSELYSRILEVEFCTNYLRLINICGSCTGDNCQGASCPRWELSGGNFPVGNYLGANCSGE